MSDRRTKNSLIFLTTLGVYLGLVLVGSCPTVLAQAATTRDYDIRSEVVIEDELDKKPDDLSSEELAALSTFDFSTALDEFARTIAKFEQNGVIKRDEFKLDFELTGSEFRLSSAAWRTPEFGNQAVMLAAWRFTERLLPENIRKLSDALSAGKNLVSKQVRTAVFLDRNELRFEVSLNKKSAEAATSLARGFERELSRKRAFAKSTAEQSYYDGVRVYSQDNQVFVVARLPRASIDEPAGK